MKTTIYFIDHPAPETLSEDATLEFRESLSLDAINTNNPEALQDAINCAEYYLSEGVHGNKGRAWIAQDGKTIWKSWESTTQGDAQC